MSVVTHGYPECDLCPQTNCDEDDEKVQLVLDDADFVKNFVNNMLNQNLEEIANDCYLMAEVISGKTSPVDIADFGYCIYVTLSQTMEMDRQKRMEIAVIFREEFDKIIDRVGQERSVAHGKPEKKAAATAAPVAPPSPARSPARAMDAGEDDESADDFLKQLDDDIAEIEALSGNVNTMLAGPVASPPPSVQPVPKPTRLEPVIKKLASPSPAQQAPAPAATPAPASGFFQPKGAATTATGSKADPIKLTKDMLHEMVSPKDLARIDKGLKIKRSSVSRGSFTAPAPAPFHDVNDTGGQGGSLLFANLQDSRAAGKGSSARGADAAHLLDFSDPGPGAMPFTGRPPPGGDTGLIFKDPLAGSGGVVTSTRNERVILCHECKELNPPANKYCKKCGFALVP